MLNYLFKGRAFPPIQYWITYFLGDSLHIRALLTFNQERNMHPSTADSRSNMYRLYRPVVIYLHSQTIMYHLPRNSHEATKPHLGLSWRNKLHDKYQHLGLACYTSQRRLYTQKNQENSWSLKCKIHDTF